MRRLRFRKPHHRYVVIGRSALLQGHGEASREGIGQLGLILDSNKTHGGILQREDVVGDGSSFKLSYSSRKASISLAICSP